MIFKIAKNRVNALFVNQTNDNNCQVYQLFELVKYKPRILLRSITQHCNTILVDNNYLSLQDLLSEKKIKNSDQSKLLLFAKVDDQYPILKGYEGGPLEPIWFNTVADEAILVLFSRRGSKILKRPIWSERFEKWVSFNNHFEYLDELDILEKLRKLIFRKMLKATLTAKDSRVLRDDLFRIMDEIIEKIRTSEKLYHDNVAVIYLLTINQQNLEYQ